MTHAFLIARQEFIKYVTRRGFAISILMFPLWIMIVIFVPQWTGGGNTPQHHRLAIVDRTGGFYRDFLTDAVARKKPVGLAIAPAPAGLEQIDNAHFTAAARRALDDADPIRDFDTIVVIPEDFARRDRAEIWRRGDRDSDLRGFVTDTLTRALQFKAVAHAAPQLRDPALLDVDVDLQYRSPDRALGANSTIDSIVPIALAIILFVVSVMNASVLLQGVVEEKSTRMIEVLLSCATPREITTGKLIGVIAVALTTLLIWGLALFVLMALASHDTVALVFTSLRAAASLETLPLLLVFFLCGLLIYGSLFLAIGSMANSLADAQSLLGPSMLILMLPNLMISGIIKDPNGPLASALSWVPIYTPFFMMLRIASHPPAYQLWGGVALAIGTAALLIWWTGRVFARHVLTTERPPSLGKLIGGLFGRRA
ncbi:MAG TPA: ABC transporter permease [Rhizomicrobium sp.]|jgi:ABC-2 type transport system permease protein|nr:ABC transporter permease [Rhizomicrobium sp.]